MNKEHQRVWAKASGRELPFGWVVHHLNSNHNDNRPENLVALPKEVHDLLHSLPNANRSLTYLESVFRYYHMLLSDLAKEQRSRKVKHVQGKIWGKGYKSRRTGKYKWIRTTTDEVEQVSSALKDVEDALRRLPQCRPKGSFRGAKPLLYNQFPLPYPREGDTGGGLPNKTLRG